MLSSGRLDCQSDTNSLEEKTLGRLSVEESHPYGN